MEFAFVIYLIGILGSIESFLTGLTFVFIALAFMIGFYHFIEQEKIPTSFWVFAFLGMFSAGMKTVIPSEKTAYMMLGAYVTQSVYESPVNQEVIGKVYKIVNKKLDQYIKEDETVKKVLEKVPTPAESN